MFNYLGFLGLFGTLITLLESFLWFKEYEQFENIRNGDTYKIALYFIGFVVINIFGYTIIPFLVRRSGATLLNISNLTTVIWSMISDIFLFSRSFVSVVLKLTISSIGCTSADSSWSLWQFWYTHLRNHPSVSSSLVKVRHLTNQSKVKEA